MIGGFRTRVTYQVLIGEFRSKDNMLYFTRCLMESSAFMAKSEEKYSDFGLLFSDLPLKICESDVPILQFFRFCDYTSRVLLKQGRSVFIHFTLPSNRVKLFCGPLRKRKKMTLRGQKVKSLYCDSWISIQIIFAVTFSILLLWL